MGLHGSTTRATTAGRSALRGLSAATMSLGVVALMLNTACYATNTRPISELKPGEEVILPLTPAGRELIASAVGDSVQLATGRYVSDDIAGIHVNVTDVQFISGISSPRANVAVTLPRSAYDSVTTRKLAKATTGWLVLGIAAAIVVLIKAINTNPSGAPAGGSGKGPGGIGT